MRRAEPWTLSVYRVRSLWMWGLLLGFTSQLVARAAHSAEEYNFSWLDPEKKIYVLQNRKFEKARKLLLSGNIGLGLSNPYRTTYSVQPRAAFYISEEWGFEVFFDYTANAVNNTFLALQQATGGSPIPSIREFRTGFGGLVHWAPWYAKINVFNQILYFDWLFFAGVGRMSTYLIPSNASQDLTPLILGTGHQFHVSRTWVVRWDFMAMLYLAPLYGTTGENTWFADYKFTVGFGLRL